MNGHSADVYRLRTRRVNSGAARKMWCRRRSVESIEESTHLRGSHPKRSQATSPAVPVASAGHDEPELNGLSGDGGAQGERSRGAIGFKAVKPESREDRRIRGCLGGKGMSPGGDGAMRVHRVQCVFDRELDGRNECLSAGKWSHEGGMDGTALAVRHEGLGEVVAGEGTLSSTRLVVCQRESEGGGSGVVALGAGLSTSSEEATKGRGHLTGKVGQQMEFDAVIGGGDFGRMDESDGA